jgi:hypothetical protein
MKVWPLLLLACLAACGDDSSGPSRVLDREFAFDDPVGDTALFAGDPGTFAALDVRRVSGTVTDDSLIFTVEFVGSVTSAAEGTPNFVVAAFGVDADNDGSTGTPVDSTGTPVDSTGAPMDSTSDSSSVVPPFTGPFPARTGVGAEFFIFVDDLSGGDAEVFRTLTLDAVGTFPVSYDGKSMTTRIPLSAIGVTPADSFRIVGVLGTPQRLTDIIPDSGSFEVGGSS